MTRLFDIDRHGIEHLLLYPIDFCMFLPEEVMWQLRERNVNAVRLGFRDGGMMYGICYTEHGFMYEIDDTTLTVSPFGNELLMSRTGAEEV